MRRVRERRQKSQPMAADVGAIEPTSEVGSVSVAMIQALIPLGLRAVEDALVREVTALAGARYARADGHPDVVRWGRQAGSVFLADQKLSLQVPRVRDRAAAQEVPLPTYQQLQTPRALDAGLFRRVLGGLSTRDYAHAADAVPEAFGLARTRTRSRGWSKNPGSPRSGKIPPPSSP